MFSSAFEARHPQDIPIPPFRLFFGSSTALADTSLRAENLFKISGAHEIMRAIVFKGQA